MINKVLDDPNGFYLHRFYKSGHLSAFEAVIDEFNRLGYAQRNRKLEENFSKFRSQKAGAFGRLLSDFTSRIEQARVTAYRKDWLFLEAEVVFILNGLLWTAMLENEEFDILNGHREQYLRKICEQFGCGYLIDGIIFPGSLRHQSDGLIEIVSKFIHFLESRNGNLEVEHKRLLTELQVKPELLTYDLGRDVVGLQKCLRLMTRLLCNIPVHVGTLLVGSFARSYTRDQFSDIDLVCICSEVPDKKMRDGLLRMLNVSSSYRFGAYEHIALQKADVQLIFVNQANQERANYKLRNEGKECIIIDFSRQERTKRYTVCGYGWYAGRILSDTHGTLASLREDAKRYPDVLRREIVLRWSSVWDRYSLEFEKAQFRNDRLTALTSLHYCIEAALRVLLACHRIYCNPVEPKWVMHNIENLAESRKRGLRKVLQYIPSDVSAPLNVRFKKIKTLWKMIPI